VSVQRASWKSLTTEQRKRLRKLPGWTVNVLSSRWEEGFRHLQNYVEANGNAVVPQKCMFNGFKLGQWVAVQRSRWNRLGDEQRQRLQKLPGWTTDARKFRWEEGFQHLQEHVEQHGDALVSQTYAIGRYKLGQWVSVQRTEWDSLSAECKRRLSELPGWAADTRTTQWEASFQRLEDYVSANGTALVPSEYVVDGFKLGRWVITQRQRWDSLADERRDKLAELPGWAVDTKAAQWEQAFQHLHDYIQENSNARVPKGHVVSGFKLGQWVANKRARWDALDDDEKRQLSALPGWTTSVGDEQWEVGFGHLLDYVKKNGDALVQREYVINGYRLGQWVTVQRQSHRKGKLSRVRRKRLAALPGWQWAPRRGA
jgi:TRAP-type C4-dicarboxylate transport system substrate-binding protein